MVGRKIKNDTPTRCIANRAIRDKLKVLFFEQATPKQVQYNSILRQILNVLHF